MVNVRFGTSFWAARALFGETMVDRASMGVDRRIERRTVDVEEASLMADVDVGGLMGCDVLPTCHARHDGERTNDASTTVTIERIIGTERSEE